MPSVATLITFPNDPATTSSVSVAGSFSNWEALPLVLNEPANQWEFDLYDYLISVKSRDEIIGKSYMYKFILNGDNWCCNILKPIVKDESGNDNNVLKIDESSGLTDTTTDVTGAVQGDNTLNTVSSTSTRSASPNSDPKDPEAELSPASSVHSIEGSTVAKTKKTDTEAEDDVESIESIDDVAVADQVSGFLGFLQWLWELILIRVFGKELKDLKKTDTTDAAIDSANTTTAST